MGEKTQSVKLEVALTSTLLTSRTMATLNNNELFLSKQVSRKAKSSSETKAKFAKCNQHVLWPKLRESLMRREGRPEKLAILKF